MEDEPYVECYSHTAARKQAEVIGKSNSLFRQFPSTGTQAAAAFLSLLLLVLTRRLWGPLIPIPLFRGLVILGVPLVVRSRVGRWDPEGRGPIGFALGYVTLLLSPAIGHVDGVRRLTRRRRVRGRYFVVEVP